MKSSIFPLIVVFLFCSLSGTAEDNPIYSQNSDVQNKPASLFSILLEPGIAIPFDESAEYLDFAGTMDIFCEYRLPAFPNLYLSSGIGYSLNPVRDFDFTNILDQSFSVFSAIAGIGLNFGLTPWSGLKLYAGGGYYYGFLNDTSRFISGGNPIVTAGGSLYFLLSRTFSLSLGASYKNYIGFFDGVDVSLGTAFHFARKKKPLQRETLPEITPLRTEGLEITNIEFEDVFPVFHKYYDDHSVGRVVLHNPENSPITEIKLSVFVNEYMDAPKECKEILELKTGERQEIELYALFASRILEITEATKAAAEISLEYKLDGRKYSDTKVVTIRLYDRNAITWDDDRRVAAFVTAKDPLILHFSKNVMSMVKESGSQAVNANLRNAIAFHEGLSAYGMTYVVDPKTPYAEISNEKIEVDFLQFPRQTLQYKAGDCDDLSILNCALLESVGIETAFITIPGHIFMAFSTGMEPDEARNRFLRPDDLIFRDDKAWIPVEVTEIDGGFLKAWETGAKQWREHSARERAGFYPTHESWKIYEPVGFSGTVTDIVLPEESMVVKAFLEELESFIDREISSRVGEIRVEMKNRGETPRTINKLGVLYARYGLLDRAEKEFRKIIVQQEHAPALINLGNIYYLQKNMEKALEYYDRAYRQDPLNPTVLLCIARIHHKLENYGITRDIYTNLKEIAPDLASRFSYLDLKGEEAIRSAEISGVKETILWEE